MSVKEYIDNQGDKIKLIGGIIVALNRMEVNLNHFLSAAFIDKNFIDQNRGILFNDILNNEKIFSSFEEKRLMFQKIVKRTDFIIKREDIDIKFDKDKYLDFCKKINKIQEIRNKVAHNYFGFRDGLAVYIKRKSEGQMLSDLEQENKGTIKEISLDLKGMLEESIDICDEFESISIEVIPKIIEVFSYDTKSI